MSDVIFEPLTFRKRIVTHRFVPRSWRHQVAGPR